MGSSKPSGIAGGDLLLVPGLRLVNERGERRVGGWTDRGAASAEICFAANRSSWLDWLAGMGGDCNGPGSLLDLLPDHPFSDCCPCCGWMEGDCRDSVRLRSATAQAPDHVGCGWEPAAGFEFPAPALAVACCRCGLPWELLRWSWKLPDCCTADQEGEGLHRPSCGDPSGVLSKL